ncbi:MAG: phosphohistidine phosphatase SixA [Oleispira sp.]|jgi:phosphohistidine phosphatase SixA
MKTNTLLFFYAYLLLSFSSVLIAANNPETPSPENALNDTRLISELRQGGYILYFRHGKTDHNTFDTDRKNLSDCSSQRLLSEEGRKEMILIGDTIKKLGIKIGSVISSPYCRSIDTATRAFGRAEINPDLKHTVIADEATMNRQAKALQKMLSKVPAIEGTNDVLSAHTANLQEAAGIWPKPEGVAIVFKPEGNSFKYIATIQPTDWQRLLSVAIQ